MKGKTMTNWSPKAVQKRRAKFLEASIAYSEKAPKSVCSCGHHGDGNNSWHADNGPAMGHGACGHAGCCCPRFTWAGWTPKYAEYQRTILF